MGLMVLVSDYTHLYIEFYGDWANMASVDTSDKTVNVLIVLLFGFSDFILDKPTQFGMQSPKHHARIQHRS